MGDAVYTYAFEKKTFKPYKTKHKTIGKCRWSAAIHTAVVYGGTDKLLNIHIYENGEFVQTIKGASDYPANAPLSDLDQLKTSLQARLNVRLYPRSDQDIMEQPMETDEKVNGREIRSVSSKCVNTAGVSSSTVSRFTYTLEVREFIPSKRSFTDVYQCVDQGMRYGTAKFRDKLLNIHIYENDKRIDSFKKY